jgi:hypothetical protein
MINWIRFRLEDPRSGTILGTLSGYFAEMLDEKIRMLVKALKPYAVARAFEGSKDWVGNGA